MVQGNTQPVFTDPEVGDYHRMLLPGTYTLTVSAQGHEDRTIPDLVVADGPATRLDVSLDPTESPPSPGDVNGDGRVDAVDVQTVVNAVLGTPVPYDCDIDQDGLLNAIDVQRVIIAVLAL